MSQGAFIRLVVGINLVILLAVIPLVRSLGGSDMAVGAGAGGLVGVANFVAVAWLIGQLLTGSESTRSVYGLLLAVKFAMILGVVAVLVRGFNIHGMGLVVGYSTMLLALLAGAARYAAVQDADGSQDED